jgi:2-methylisocitrate lyase-like PEP mutase family enzyme
MTLDAADQHRRGLEFRRLHEGPAFVVPNPWDAGSARMLAQLGFPALASTSGGLAFSLGRPDGQNLVSLEDTLANIRLIAGAAGLPVSADLESGFGATPAQVGATIRRAAEAGAVGGSVEDATGDPGQPVRPLPEAAERVAAAAAAARALSFPFTVTARAENFLYGRPDLDDTIRRLQAYQEAGADVLYAPGLPGLDAVRAVCAAVDRPVNALAGGSTAATVAALSAAGVQRISLGSALARAAMGAALAAAREIREHGTFGRTAAAPGYAEINAPARQAGGNGPAG